MKIEINFEKLGYVCRTIIIPYGSTWADLASVVTTAFEVDNDLDYVCSFENHVFHRMAFVTNNDERRDEIAQEWVSVALYERIQQSIVQNTQIEMWHFPRSSKKVTYSIKVTCVNEPSNSLKCLDAYGQIPLSYYGQRNIYQEYCDYISGKDYGELSVPDRSIDVKEMNRQLNRKRVQSKKTAPRNELV